MRKFFLISLALLLLMPSLTVSANNGIFYTSNPDDLSIFLNNVAFAQDEIQLPADSDVQIILPSTIFLETLLVYENDERVQRYRISQQASNTVLRWTTGNDTELRNVRLQYLISGIGWTPKHDMWINSEEEVDFDFFAEIINSNLSLEDVTVRLIEGQVDVTQQINYQQTVTTNQFIAGYENDVVVDGDVNGQPPQLAGGVTIQNIYDAETLSSEAGDIIYLALLQETFEARRVLLWNAYQSNDVDVIYKVRNSSEIPIPSGIVRSYQNGLFLGSDFIESTPISGEGSVTVGDLRTVRVNREESTTVDFERNNDIDTLHEIRLNVTNLGTDPIDIEIVDRYPQQATLFEYEQDPEQLGDNLLKWIITVNAGETVTVSYEFRD